MKKTRITTIYEVKYGDGDVRTLTASTESDAHPTIAFDMHEEKLGAIERKLIKEHHSI